MCNTKPGVEVEVSVPNVPVPPSLPRISAAPRRIPPISPNNKDSKSLEPEMLYSEGFRYLIPQRLAFISGSLERLQEIRQQLEATNLRFFSSDLHEQYDPFGNDFGPVNLGIVHRFCNSLKKLMAKGPDQTLVYCMDTTFEAQANASFLLGAFLVLKCGRTPQEAAEPFTCSTAPFTLRSFRDCTNTAQSYEISLLDCLNGLVKAARLGWYDPDTFDLDQYEELDDPNNGDIHQICPKFVAFKGPLAERSRHREAGEIAHAPSAYAPTLVYLNVACVVRLNDRDTYDSSDFEEAGLRHCDLYFDDCTPPSDGIVEGFLAICDAEPGRIAVHCRAGLGRTGTLIALWMMRHCGFSANEAIGWLRIVRPGSVIGPQQQYLKDCERRPWHGNRLGRAVGAVEGGRDQTPAPPGRRTSCDFGKPTLQIYADTVPPPGPPILTKRPTPPARPPGTALGGAFDVLSPASNLNFSPAANLNGVASSGGGGGAPSASELSRQVTAGMSRRGMARALNALLPRIRVPGRFGFSTSSSSTSSSPASPATPVSTPPSVRHLPSPPLDPVRLELTPSAAAAAAPVVTPAAAGSNCCGCSGGAGGGVSPCPPPGPAKAAERRGGRGGRLSLPGLGLPSLLPAALLGGRHLPQPPPRTLSSGAL